MTNPILDKHPVIQLQQVTKHYGLGEAQVRALDGNDLTIQRGEFVAIMGTSGSGKSTLMNIVGALDIVTTGSYELDGINIDRLSDDALSVVRNRKIGFVFQSFNLIPRTTALANVELPLAYRGMERKERRRRALAALDSVGLGDRADHGPTQLSGGQQQRVAIARALVTNPSLVLADEPTGNLDSSSTSDVLDLLQSTHYRGNTIVLITHEDEVAARAQRVIHLVDGRIASDERVH
ncbi:MAG TPA: ABC transporter [Actinobacteria bacterium]|nr:ABC transporter [Actinomycetota bacterium]